MSVQAMVLNPLLELRERRGLTYLFIPHDLSVAERFCDRVAIMYLRRIVELAPTGKIFASPRHPYKRALLSAVPRLAQNRDAPRGPLRASRRARPARGLCLLRPVPLCRAGLCRRRARTGRRFGPSGRLPALAGAFPGSARRLTTLRRHLFEISNPTERGFWSKPRGPRPACPPPFPPPQARRKRGRVGEGVSRSFSVGLHRGLGVGESRDR
ncbi:MAG TPA: ABC transporter ATP-binding protein, partial [Stellaceae bacterium]|nr:ABC transporter ATP-binding protein [Stellaceae bacterium]